jgi:crotonyl-CoA carboxylase/reductase
VTRDLYPLGDVPDLGVVPATMLAQVIRADRFGEPVDAFARRPIAIPRWRPTTSWST